MNQIVKIILAILLLLCLVDFPYSYYQFVRFAGMIGFGFLAYSSNEEGKNTEMFIFLALAILFQPFYKISLGRELWNVVDVAVAIGLIYSLSKNKKD